MRQTGYRGFNARAGLNPYRSWARVLDCGDIPVSPLDNQIALRQLSEAYLELGFRLPAVRLDTAESIDTEITKFPKLVTLGGDHSIALPALRALYEVYQQPIAVVHFDAHLDVSKPTPGTTKYISDMSTDVAWDQRRRRRLLVQRSVQLQPRLRLLERSSRGSTSRWLLHPRRIAYTTYRRKPPRLRK